MAQRRMKQHKEIKRSMALAPQENEAPTTATQHSMLDGPHGGWQRGLCVCVCVCEQVVVDVIVEVVCEQVVVEVVCEPVACV